MILGNLSYGFDAITPMVGFANFLSGNLGDFEAGYGFKLSPHGVASDPADCEVSTKVPMGQFSLLQPLAIHPALKFQVLIRAPPSPHRQAIGTIPAPMYCKLRYAIGGVMVASISFLVVTFASNLTSRSLKEDCPCDCHLPFVLP
jgi:hypothetical protein